MTMVGKNIGPYHPAVIHDDITTHGSQLRHGGMPVCSGTYAFGIAQERPHQVYIMNTVIQDLHPRLCKKEFPQMPGRVYIDIYFDVAEVTDKPFLYNVSCCNDIRRIP